MKPVAVDPMDYGTFYTGDSYLVLAVDAERKRQLFTWIGTESSQDEQAAAAISVMQVRSRFVPMPAVAAAISLSFCLPPQHLPSG